MTTTNIPRLVLVGLPNVGKSSVLNRLIGRRQAIVHEVAHTTRDSAVHRLQLRTSNKRWIEVQDAPGLTEQKDELWVAAMAQLDRALGEADGVLFIVDAAQTPSTTERKLATRLHKQGIPVFVIANQVDKAGALPEQYQTLGFERIYGVSAIHGTGFDELRQVLDKTFPGVTTPPPRQVHVALLGRPNVGKSSLTNALAGSEVALVSAQAGTTRDPVFAEANFNDQPWRLIDTAGIRRPGKIARGIEYFSYTRAQEVIDEADICLLVLDAVDGATGQDQRLVGMIAEAGRALIIVVNKIDQIEPADRARHLNRMQQEFAFAKWAQAAEVSALTKAGLGELTLMITDLSRRLDPKLSTPELNRLLTDITTKHPPTTTKSYRPKLNYMVQTGTRPLTLVIFGSHPDAVHFSYQRYIENDIRKHFDLRGMPVVVKLASKHKEEKELRKR